MYELVDEFENTLAGFFGAPAAVATDCCTHALELCLRLVAPSSVGIPCYTYPSVAFTCDKLDIARYWVDDTWQDYYHLQGTNIIDAAVFWQPEGYISGSMMCVSFQWKKHLSLGRGGLILLDNLELAKKLRRMSYDGRQRGLLWKQDDITEIGYHYYMTPETAALGLEKFPGARDTPPKRWGYLDYPYLPDFTVFKKRSLLP